MSQSRAHRHKVASFTLLPRVSNDAIDVPFLGTLCKNAVDNIEEAAVSTFRYVSPSPTWTERESDTLTGSLRDTENVSIRKTRWVDQFSRSAD